MSTVCYAESTCGVNGNAPHVAGGLPRRLEVGVRQGNAAAPKHAPLAPEAMLGSIASATAAMISPTDGRPADDRQIALRSFDRRASSCGLRVFRPKARLSVMLFRDQKSGVIAISQLTHAWISGQLLRAWDEPLPDPLLLAGEQHDLGWIDWEVAPSFDERSGRPHLFRDIGASLHAPMWAGGVDRALAAWGMHVALLISRHGGVIYNRYTNRHRLAEADAAAAQHYLETQSPREQAWARELGLDEAQLTRESGLIAFVDALSLALCGELKTPIDFEAPERGGGVVTLHLGERPEKPFEFVLSPWPFRMSELIVEGEARPLPREGRFSDEAAMRRWLAEPERVTFTARLASR